MALEHVTYPPRALDREVVAVMGIFNGGDTGNPTRMSGSPGLSMTRTAAGKYTVTLPAGNIRAVNVSLLGASSPELSVFTKIEDPTAASFALETKEVSFDTDHLAWANADVDSTRAFCVIAYIQNTKS